MPGKEGNPANTCGRRLPFADQEGFIGQHVAIGGRVDGGFHGGLAPPGNRQLPSPHVGIGRIFLLRLGTGGHGHNPGKSALLKPVETLTQGEMQDMIASAQTDYRGWRSGDPLKAHTYEKVQDWHVNIYGDGPQQYDGGKPVEPIPIRPIPEQPSPHTTPQGEDLWQATGRIGRKVAEAGAADGFDAAVKGLQRGLNILGEANPLPARSPAYGSYTKLGPVAEDGKYGPQTDFALKHATARLGPAKVDEAFALGRFNTFARNAQTNGTAEGLENRAHAIFGPLFRDPRDTKAPKVEAGVLQETLNGFGQTLKVDNWIGPKTTEAFGTVLKEQDADILTGSFGRGLGLL